MAYAMYTAGWKPAFFSGACDFSLSGLTVGSTGCAGSRAASTEERTFSSDMAIAVDEGKKGVVNSAESRGEGEEVASPGRRRA